MEAWLQGMFVHRIIPEYRKYMVMIECGYRTCLSIFMPCEISVAKATDAMDLNKTKVRVCEDWDPNAVCIIEIGFDASHVIHN